jgi:hypothetical protein
VFDPSCLQSSAYDTNTNVVIQFTHSFQYGLPQSVQGCNRMSTPQRVLCLQMTLVRMSKGHATQAACETPALYWWQARCFTSRDTVGGMVCFLFLSHSCCLPGPSTSLHFITWQITIRGHRPPPRLNWIVLYSGLLREVVWNRRFGTTYRPIFKGQTVDR